MSRVGDGHWVMLRAQLQRRSYRPDCFDTMIENMTAKQAWYAFDTMRRWHANGHAERAEASAVAWRAGAHHGIGTIERFTYYESPGADLP